MRDIANDTARAHKIAAARSLVSYMNDTKWRELCEGFRQWATTPRFRIHDLLADDGYVSEWDREWYYHPRPYLSIEWLEVELTEEQISSGISLCKSIGVATVERTSTGLRIWGWVGSTRPLFV